MDSLGIPMFGVNGWLPNGMKVFYNMPLRSPETAFEDALAFTNALLVNGFTQTEPSLGRGEHTELIGSVSRREKVNKDGTISTVLDLYAAAQHLTFRYMAVYLDTPEDVQAFEVASGLKVDGIPMNEADAPPNKENAKLVVRTAKPLTVVYVNNPDYDETSDAKKPKRLFVRWDGQSNVLPLDTPPNGAQYEPRSPKQALNGNGQVERRIPPQTTENAPAGNVVANKGIWEYDLPSLMAHPDLVTMYPQFQHRSNAIKLLHDGGFFANVTDLSAAVKVVLSRPDKQEAVS